MNRAIEESWRDYECSDYAPDKNEKWAHEHGWKDGAEWVLTELLIDKKISENDFKKYMSWLYEH